MREFPRVSLELPCQIDDGHQTFVGQVVNLSVKGAFVTLTSTPSSSDFLYLKFSLLPRQEQLEFLARVVRRDHRGMGVKFLDVAGRAKHTLWQYLLPFLMKGATSCFFCGASLPDPQTQHCPRCQRTLDFARPDYMSALLAEEEDQPEEMVGTCPAIRQVFHLIRKLAPSDVPVLITGASGTGKEMVARAIHERSHRAHHPFVPINCGAIPRELLESELFGHEKGAFTGAYRSNIGTVERAHLGTLFLDEVGELPLELQVKILRFLQDFTFTRVGGRTPRQVDTRVLAATNADLKELIRQGRFREDLYYRLNVVEIHLPPLKDRGDDPLIMANVFLKNYAAKVGKEVRGLTPEASAAIMAYSWPGNVRELVNRIRRGVILAEGPWLTPQHLGLISQELQPADFTDGLGLKEAKAKFEAKLVADTLHRFQGNALLASQALKISRSMLYHLVQKYDLKHYLVAGPADGSSRHGDTVRRPAIRRLGPSRKGLDGKTRGSPPEG